MDVATAENCGRLHMLYEEFEQRIRFLFPNYLIIEDADGYFSINTSWRRDPDEPIHVYLDEEDDDGYFTEMRMD